MAPRATTIEEQGFSEAVAARIEAPQRGSIRSVNDPKWCIINGVDFRAPPIKSVTDFLMCLFEDRKLQPSTIDGYRSAIADKLGILPVIISKYKNLTRLLDSLHRDRPKGRRGIPSWNLSLVLHQLTKVSLTNPRGFFQAPDFQDLGQASAEVRFMLGKTEYQTPICFDQRFFLYPSPSFLFKNQLAKRVQTVRPQWLYQPWPQLWIGPSSLTGPSFRLEHCAAIWTGPQTSGRIRKWL